MIRDVPPEAPRVSVRRVHDGGAEDVVGHLLAANDQWLVVLPEDRPEVWIPRHQAEAVRQVPERTVLPVSRGADLERALHRARSAGPAVRLGGWRLDRRAVLAVGDPGLPFAEAVAAAEGRLGHPAQLRVLGEAWPEAAALGFRPVAVRLVTTTEAPGPHPGETYPLARGWVGDVDAGDPAAVDAARGTGFTLRHRATILARG